MSELEKKLIEENKRLNTELAQLRDALQQFGHHAIDVDGDDWLCPFCGKREPLERSTDFFEHETYCPLWKEG